MQKDFPNWNALKIKLNDNKQKVFWHPREIWICSIGANVGSEEDGKNENFARPVLIFKAFNENMFWGIPITSKSHTGKSYFRFKHADKDNEAILSQMRILSPKRLGRKVGVMSEDDFARLRNQLIRLL